ncbi:MAG TPA: DAK2 domain-containing protein, partial [Anaerolineales bacterium]|nr:DAK2 domain-containing protein [Anaerolineales bacterium]
MNQHSSQRQNQGLDLSAIFKVAAQALAANQHSLNQADTLNENHGDNMVQTFNMISQAMASHQGASPSAQLQHASDYLSQNAASGSGQLYAQGLAQAAQQFQGQSAITPNNAM